MICNILGIITPFLLNILCAALLRIREKILHIGDMLLEYIFLHFGPTRSVYKLGIFTFVPICPSLSINLPLSRTSLAPLPYVAILVWRVVPGMQSVLWFHSMRH